MFKAITFLLLTAILIRVSRVSLRSPRSHGFYRFFAWETTLGLLLINLDGWFADPFSSRQLASWVFLAASVYLVAHGACLLRVVGKPHGGHRQEPCLYDIEKTSTLVTVGAYRYIRHPLYTSGLCGTWGILLKDVSWPSVLLALAASAFWIITAKVEETECIRYFGSEYQAYMDRTRMFVPFLF
jgi:protein-S-isoprenylcysteine O-methyltransferase Ste14